MRQMEEKILREGTVLPGGILKVGSFLNQQIDTAFLREIGREIARLYAAERVNKILTIEASGIAIAAAAAMEMGVPMLFAKMLRTSYVDGIVFSATAYYFTHGSVYTGTALALSDGNVYTFLVCRDYLQPAVRGLLVDDFLANGAALRGLIALVDAAGATLVGAAVAIEKRFQNGGDRLRTQGIRVESLACIRSMENGNLVFDTVSRAGDPA